MKVNIPSSHRTPERNGATRQPLKQRGQFGKQANQRAPVTISKQGLTTIKNANAQKSRAKNQAQQARSVAAARKVEVMFMLSNL
jgi:hypothetical protein